MSFVCIYIKKKHVLLALDYMRARCFVSACTSSHLQIARREGNATHPEDVLEVVLVEEQVHGTLSETAAAARRHAETTPAHAQDHGTVSVCNAHHHDHVCMCSW
jgi:hypothetical protein